MSTDAKPARGSLARVRVANARPPRRVLVLYEHGRNGSAALSQAAELAAGTDATLAVVTLARQDPANRCCGPSRQAFNCAVREQAGLELHEARELLGPAADRAELKVLVGSPEPRLAAWAAEQDFDVVLLPRRRLTPGGHPAARRLRRATASDVRLVG